MISQALRPLLDYDMVGTLFKKAASYIDIPSLFRVAGREGVYYGESWDEILKQNQKALGPELVNGGWVTSSGPYDNVTTETSPTSFTTVAGASPARVAERTSAVNPQGKTFFIKFRVTRVPTSGTVIAYARGVLTTDGVGGGTTLANSIGISTTGWYSFQATASTHPQLELLFVSSTAAQSFDVEEISVREIADWSKLVFFDDPNGTVPVFSALQSTRGRGLLLDRSKGLVRGPELAPTSVSALEWTQVNVTASSGDSITTSGAGGIRAALLQSNKTYEITVSGSTTVGMALWNSNTNAGQSLSFVAGPVSARVIWQAEPLAAGTFLYLRLGNTGTFTGTISAKEIPGNHMRQPTSTARGEISRRVNFLSSTENLGGTWARQNTTVTVSNGVSTLTRNSTTNSCYVAQATSLAANTLNKATIEVKKGAVGNLFGLRIQGTYPDRCDMVVDLDTGLLVGPATSTNYEVSLASSTPIGDGWYTLELQGVSTTNSTTAVQVVLGSAAAGSVSGWEGATAALGEVLVRKPQIRLAEDYIPSLPPYQWVNNPNDYDEVGFPAYYRGQTDDWAATFIDPNGATKLFILTSIQKMTDIAVATLMEGTNSSAGNTGTFAIFAPLISGTARLTFRSRGTAIQSDISTASNAPAPARLVVTAIGNIFNDISSISINGGAFLINTADQGEGSYRAQSVFFGARAGTSLFMNYREYAPQLIIFCQTADPGPSAAQIKRLQRKFAKAIGVTL
jgi:hypothetical protein